MSAVTWLEPGGDATFGIALFDANNGSPATATDFVHGSHVKSIKYPSGGANNNGKKGTLADSGSRVSFWLYVNALPTATCSFFDALTTGFGTGVLVFRCTSGGVLQLFSSGVQLGSNGPTLATGSWHRLSFAYTITNTTTFTAKVWVDGVLGLTVSNTGTLASTGSSDALFGNITGDTTFDTRFSDFYIDNSASLTDPGNIWVTAKRPNANGTNVQFTTQIGSGGSGYGSGHSPQVNERPENDANGWSISTTSVQTEEYNIEGVSTGDINISGATIVDYMGWIRAAESTTANSPVSHIILNGVSTAVTLTTSGAYYTAIAGSTTYPAGTGTDIGMDGAYTSVAGTYSLYECGVVVAYIPSSGVNSNMLMFM
jgi:hypothetical protein